MKLILQTPPIFKNANILKQAKYINLEEFIFNCRNNGMVVLLLILERVTEILKIY